MKICCLFWQAWQFQLQGWTVLGYSHYLHWIALRALAVLTRSRIIGATVGMHMCD